jgi:hypothetical protein
VHNIAVDECGGCVRNWTETHEVRGPNSMGFWTVAVPVMSGKCQTCNSGYTGACGACCHDVQVSYRWGVCRQWWLCQCCSTMDMCQRPWV